VFNIKHVLIHEPWCLKKSRSCRFTSTTKQSCDWSGTKEIDSDTDPTTPWGGEYLLSIDQEADSANFKKLAQPPQVTGRTFPIPDPETDMLTKFKLDTDQLRQSIWIIGALIPRISSCPFQLWKSYLISIILKYSSSTSSCSVLLCKERTVVPTSCRL